MEIDSSLTLKKVLTTFYKVPNIPEDDELFADHLRWCLEHCNGQFMDVRQQGARIWFFEFEQDAIMFSLKWSDHRGH